MSSSSWPYLLLTAGVIAAGTQACIIDDVNHCAVSGANCQTGEMCDPCVLSRDTVRGDGCVAMEDLTDRDPGVAGCQIDDGPAVTTDVTDPSTTTVGATDTTIDPSETDSMGTTETTTGGDPCVGNEDCVDDPGGPFCQMMTGVCVGCSGTEDPDGSCAELDGNFPLCVGGTCVQCTEALPDQCENDTPVCDPTTNMCIGCSAHADCGEAACNFYTGACLDGRIVTVGTGQDEATVAAALNLFADDEDGTIIIHEASLIGALTVDGTRSIGFLAASGVLPEWDNGVGSTSQIVVSQGSTIVVDGIRFASNTSSNPAISVTSGNAWFDRTRFAQNSGGAVAAASATNVTLRNCFVQAPNDVIALDLQSTPSDILYTTVGVDFGTAQGLVCGGGETVTVRNSVIVSRGTEPEVACPGLVASNTVTETVLDGMDNTGLGDMESMMGATDWFSAYNSGEFFIETGFEGVFAGLAQWQEGDPDQDIEGDPRPAGPGMDDFPGADVP